MSTQLTPEQGFLTTENGATSVGNANQKFRDGFIGGVDPLIWDESWTNQGTGFTQTGGNSSGAKYICVSMCPFTKGMEYSITTKQAFNFPSRFGYGLTMSQRIAGQEVEVSLIGVDDNNVVEVFTPSTPKAISGTITIASNVATINYSENHGYHGGDRIILKDNVETRLNVGPVVVTVVNNTQITVPCILASGTYTAGGTTEIADYFAYASNALGYIYESTTTTTANLTTRRNGSAHFTVAQTGITTTAVQQNTSPYTEAFRTAGVSELIATIEAMKGNSGTANSTSQNTGTGRIEETLPDEEKMYKLRIRIKNLNNFSTINGEIASIVKSGTAIATVTTVLPHGLTNGLTFFGQVYGVRDQTNFPNLTALTAITITGANTFTVTIGSASSTSSVGGIFSISDGGVLIPGALNFSIQSISRTNNVLIATLNTTASGLIPGEWVQLYGMDSTASAYDGSYKVLRITGSTVEFESSGVDFGSITCGGAIFKRTDVRIHFVRELEYTRLLAEITNGRGSADGKETIPVTATGGTLSVVQSTSASIGTTGTGAWLVRGGSVRITDIASAAITSTATSSATDITGVVGSHQFTFDTTAISGTGAYMRPRIQASLDGGTNYVNIWDGVRIVNSTDKTNFSPVIPVEFTHLRYIRTIAGTTPSCTNSVIRTVRASGEARRVRQMNDIALSLTSVVGTRSTEYLYVGGCTKCQISCTPLTGATTPSAMKLIGCNGNPSVATNWFDITGATITTSASAMVSTDIFNLPPCKFIALEITTQGVGTITSLYDLLIQAYE